MKAQVIGLLLSVLSFVVAVFNDEAFVTDWKIKQIGDLSEGNVLLYPEENLLNLLSTTNTLAGIENGDVKWRVSFDNLNTEARQRLLSFGDKSVIATVLNFINSRSVIQLWNSTDGFLIKDLAEFKGEIKQVESDLNGNILAVFVDGKTVITDKSGKILVETVIEFSDDVKISSYSNGHFSIIYNKGKDTHLAFYDGTELKTQQLDGVPYDSIRDVFGSKIVYELQGKFYSVSINKLSGGLSKHYMLPSFEKFIPNIQSDEFIAFEKNHNIEVITVDGDAQFTIPNVYKYEFKFVDSVFILYTEFHVNIIDVDTGEELKSYFFGPEGKIQYEDITSFYIDTNGVDEVYSLVHHKDSTFNYLLNNATLWTRDTSLSEVLAHVVVDLPVDSPISYDEIIYEEGLSLINAYLFRVKRHILELREAYESFWEMLPKWAVGEWSFESVNNDRYFGFEKYLVLGTRSGKVIALNTLDGYVVWSFNVEHDDILQIENVGNEKLYVFTKSGPRFTLNALTGELINKDVISPPKNIVHLAEDSFLLELSNGFDVVLSNSESLNDKYIVKHDERVIQGFKIENKQSKSTWIFSVTSDEKIVGFSAKQDDVIASVGYVMGNRDVLYKYLYPNLAAFGVLNKVTKTLYVHIIDTITGNILYSAYHDELIHEDEHFNIVFGEHWVVYSYWSNLPSPEQKITVVDLFESPFPNKRSSATNGTESAFESRDLPFAQSKSFFLPSRIKNLGISKTKFGVTTKSVIVALENHQIFYLPKYVLNSRRVENRDLTADEKAEFMLLPYDPVILIDDNTVISHNREVIAGDVLISVPTNLESTSIVCTYGLDVFCTRISPSLQFDKLTSSFDKTKLIMSVIALAVLIGFLRPMAESRKLKAAWIQEKQ